MGTRGAMVFVADGQTKVMYNHYDSYPDGLGYTMLNWLISALSPGELEGVLPEPLLRKAVTSLVAVDENHKPTPEEAATFAPYSDPNVSEGNDWYAILRHTQGDPQKTLRAGHYLDSTTAWLADSLFCEWAYVIDFDERVFEVYKGFQNEPHTAGRFADLPLEPKATYEGAKQYYPVKLLLSFSFDVLPSTTLLDLSVDAGHVITQAELEELVAPEEVAALENDQEVRRTVLVFDEATGLVEDDSYTPE